MPERGWTKSDSAQSRRILARQNRDFARMTRTAERFFAKAFSHPGQGVGGKARKPFLTYFFY
jgi:hypothetical protein